ncbi:ATP-binding protein [Oceanobacillus massiliensis]|uniref:ATP-binding protein n=1 Tax=Oceanobacillus massiliensis TaxID=1465765 RepID=UPI00301A6B1F
MKGIFHKIRREHATPVEEITESYEPELTHLDSYERVKKRALVGWIASRCAAALQIAEREREALFYLAFSNESFEQLEDGVRKELLMLADSAADWIAANAVIEEEMKSVNPAHSSKIVLERVFNEIQSDVKSSEQLVDESQKTWQVYRDVIYAATQGRFLLIGKQDVAKYKSNGLLCEMDIRERQDVPKARNVAKEAFAKTGMKSSKVLSYNLIISEAVTNILKHAEHGKMLIYQNEDVFNIVIEDKGPGFPLAILPKATLMAGFSTKESLGQGFTLMMKMANQVLLETSDKGSTLILVLEAGKE